MAKMMTIRPPDELKKELQKRAKTRGLTLNAYVIEILWNYVNGKAS